MNEALILYTNPVRHRNKNLYEWPSIGEYEREFSHVG